MNIRTRIARLEKATDDLPTVDDSFDPSDLGQFLVEYALMVESLPDYFAAQDQQLRDRIAKDEARIAAEKDFPGVRQSLEGMDNRWRRDLAIRAAFMDYWQAEQTGLDVAGALERFQKASNRGVGPRGDPWHSHWIHSLHHPPRTRGDGYNIHCERVDQFWKRFWQSS